MKTFLMLLKLSILFFVSFPFFANAQKMVYNVDAEELVPATKMPKGWSFSFNPEQKLSYTTQLDTVIKQAGRHSISIQKVGKQSEFGAIDYMISKIFAGKTIVLKGYLKTERIDSGYAGLWMRIDGKSGPIAFNNMTKENIKGSTDWTQYTIDLPYNSDAAKEIHIGGLLVGKGKAWFDDFQLFIDGKPVNEAAIKEPSLPKADLDTAFSTSSGIAAFKTNPQIINNLVLAGQFWGFLKYHHPSIAKGDYNWDAELFRFLPQVIAAKDHIVLSHVLEAYLDKLPVPAANTKAPSVADKVVALKPDYGQIFDSNALSKSIIDKLNAVKNSSRTPEHYYLSFAGGPGNPQFLNEKAYEKMTYPDAGYRLLSLYRYWAIINYFFPYKDVIGADWNKTLTAAIPEFVAAKDAQAYALAALKLIAGIHDTHANIWTNVALNNFKGKYKLPFKADFIENKLVVTGYYYGDTLSVKQKFLIGDVISSINGRATDLLVKKFLPYTAASNYETQLRDLPGSFLLRGHSEVFYVGLNRAGKSLTQKTKGLEATYYPKSNPLVEKTAFKLLDNGIAYVYPGKYKNTDLPAIKALFKNTRGMVIDMRCYPSDFMPFTFGKYIKSISSPFVKFTLAEHQQPGSFIYAPPLNNGAPSDDTYKGKIVIIVNSTSQSNAEYTTMAFQSSANVTVIGSTTAGADGNVSKIALPGGISTMISGIGIFYPDGSPTQRVGVKIDHVIRPTIKGIVEGRDELLEKAKALLMD